MRNNYQSKAVPRGTRTIWRYLGALFILFTFAVGNVWADLTPALPATTLTLPNVPTEGWKGNVTPTYYKAAGSNVYVFNPYELYTSVANLTWTTQNSGGNGSGSVNAMAPFPASSVFTGYKAATVKTTEKGPYAYRVTNCVAAYIYVKSGSDKKRTITLAAFEVDGEGNVAASAAASNTYETNSDGVISISLNKDKEYYIKVSQVCSGSGGSSSGNSTFYMVAFQAPYKVTLDPDGGAYPSNTLSGWTYDNVSGKYTKYVTAGSLTLPEGPAKGGYNFVEWQDNQGSAFSSITVSKDTVLTAQWQSSSAQTHDITYTNLKGSDVSAYPTKYYEGTGIASFDPLADVTDFHFNGWSPASIAADATTDQTISATWVDAYNVTFSYGAGGGTVPASFQKWQGAKFNLPGQGSMTAPSGKVFDGWKASGTKYAENAEYTMGNDAVEFVAQWKAVPTTIFHWRSNISSNPSLDQVISATGGSLTTRSYKTSSKGSFQTQSVSSYVAGTPDDMKANSGKSGIKCNNNDVYLKLALSSGKLKSGDTIWICGYGTIKMYKSITLGSGYNDQITSLTMSGTGTNTFGVNTTACVIPQVENEDVEYDSLCLTRNSNGYLAAIKIVRPAQKDVKSTTYDLTAVKINGTAISAENLATLKTADAYLLDLASAYGVAPVVKFARETTITYDDDSEKVTNDTITVTASEVSSKWQAQATIGTITYTVKMTKVVSDDATLSSLTYQLGSADPVAVSLEENKYAYAVELPFGTTTVPTVAGTANDANAKSVVVTQASALPGFATVVVTAEDNSTKTYTVNFTLEASKDIRMAWATSVNFCSGATKYSSAVKSDNALVSAYINKITFTNVEGSGDDGAEGGSLNVGKKAGNMFTLAAKPGYAMKAMQFAAKIQDATCQYSLDGGEWTTLSSTNTGGDDCYTVFTDEEVHEFRLRSTGTSGVWIRNMELDIIAACTPKTIAWTAAPASEYEVGATVDPIAASANNGDVEYAASNGAITVAANGALTINSLTNAINLSASVAAGDGTTYCATGASVVKEGIKTYHLVKLDAQNETSVTEVKYYSGAAAIALPTPSYSGYNFQGWFDAETGGNQITEAITPSASMTVYAQWIAQCAGPSIETQPVGANYFVGRTASALSCTATPGVDGKALTYTWYSCDDAERTNPVALAAAPTPSTAAVGTFYYYCAVTEEDCDVIRNSNVAVVNVKEKDQLLLVKVVTTGGTNKTVTGYCAKGADVSLQSDRKFGSNSYMGFSLDGRNFQENDVLNVHITDASTSGTGTISLYAKKQDQSSLIHNFATAGVVGDNKLPMTDAVNSHDTLYICRTSANGWNAYVDSITVYRPYPTPVLEAISIDGIPATKGTGNTFSVKIPAISDVASLTIDEVVMSNDPSQTSGAIQGAWALGNNTYRVTDKDGDYTDYTIVLSQAAAIDHVEISGTLTVEEMASTTLTALVKDVNGDDAEIQNVTWSIPAAEATYATVNNGVVSALKEGTVHVTATSDADNTKSATVEVTITEKQCREWNAPAAEYSDATISVGKLRIAKGDCVINNAYLYVENTQQVTGYCYKVDGSNKYIQLNYADNAQFESLELGLTSSSNGSTPKYVVVLASDAEFANVLSATEYTANAKDGAKTHTEITLLSGTRYVRIYRSYNSKGDGTSVFLYHVAACKKAFVPVTAVAVADANLAIGKSMTLSATTTPANADISSFTWSIVQPMTATGVSLEGNVLTAAANATEGNVVVKVVAKDVLNNEVEATATIHVVNHFDAITPVTETTTWSWETLTVPSGDGPKIAANDTVLANYLSGAEWEQIAGTFNEYVYRSNDNKYYQGTKLNIRTTVPGVLSIKARRAEEGDKLYVNGDKVADLTTNMTTYKLAIPAGDVKITGDAKMRVAWMQFQTLDEVTPDYTRPVTIDRMGTVCVDHNVPAGCIIGAEVYRLLYWKYGTSYADCQMVDFEQVDEMEAGNPYLIIPTEETFKLYYGAVVDETPNTVNHFIGTYAAIAQGTEGDAKLMGKYGVVNNQIRLLGAGAYSPANRAYIDLENLQSKEEYEAANTSSPAPKKRISLSREGTAIATGLDAINVETENVQKVMIDGQIYIIRGGHIFTGTGMLVK